MNVTLCLDPEVEKALTAQAQARGVSLDDYLQKLVARERGCRAPWNRVRLVFSRADRDRMNLPAARAREGKATAADQSAAGPLQGSLF